VLAVICFYGMTYVVMALNLGWRFGYWVAAATLSAMLLMMSVFWLVTGLGPQGKEGHWVPLGSGADRISQVSLKGKPLSAPGQYPGGDWAPAEVRGLEAEGEDFSSAISNCLTTAPKALGAEEKEVCSAAQDLMPKSKDVPVIAGSAVALTPDLSNVKFANDNGALLAEATVTPNTHDPRVANDFKKGKALAPSFVILAVKNKGTLRVPAFASVGIFALLTALHLAGLNRAEHRKLSPVV
jgi:hypothetical protein